MGPKITIILPFWPHSRHHLTGLDIVSILIHRETRVGVGGLVKILFAIIPSSPIDPLRFSTVFSYHSPTDP